MTGAVITTSFKPHPGRSRAELMPASWAGQGVSRLPASVGLSRQQLRQAPKFDRSGRLRAHTHCFCALLIWAVVLPTGPAW